MDASSVLFWYFAGVGLLVHLLQITRWGMQDLRRFILFYRRWKSALWPQRPDKPRDVDRAA